MPPIRFAFGLHLHQPVGNFDHVFEQHVRDVYRPLLEHLSANDFLPVTLHVSGPLLEWLEAHDTRYLDQLGRLVADGRVELLLAGFYEPVLASLPRADRVEQIGWLRETLHHRFGIDARGLWLTERVWEPELAADLADAGVRYALVDDRHFLVTGFAADQLHAPYWTESDGKRVALFPIDERLRYLIPFRPPEETVAYLRDLRAAGRGLAVLADDGEKFGGWPGTKTWVYERGWLDQFTRAIGDLVASGEVMLSTFADALDHVPSAGLAYLPTASYREMESWSLPPNAALRLRDLEELLGESRLAGPDGALVRGAHWRNFLVKYPESNRMHKKMVALSQLARERGDPLDVRRDIGQAQCNDAYWHGVFGGLYLPHLRNAVWYHLARAEATLRHDEHLAAEMLDFDGDGHDEVWVHSSRFSALVSPRRGGALEEFTLFAAGINYANTLTRRREAYHELALARHAAAEHQSDGTPSIHDIEDAVHLDELPPVDADVRAIAVDRILAADTDSAAYQRAEYRPLRSWAGRAAECTVEGTAQSVTVRCTFGDLVKELRFAPDGAVRIDYWWDADATGGEGFFAPELSLAGALAIHAVPEAEIWRFDIETVAKSERGLDRTRQGESVTLRWPAWLGAASLELKP